MIQTRPIIRRGRKLLRRLFPDTNSSDLKSNRSFKLPLLKSNIAVRSAANSLVHLSAYSEGNAGDMLLPIALQDLWNSKQGSSWISDNVRKTPNIDFINKINELDGLVIGGGGLFLRDTNQNEISGWQWPCSIELMEQIKVPMILFAVGYNRFRGQEEFEPFFTENINKLAEKSLYIGLRNHGSIESVKSYLKPELQDKIRFQPCMTTVLNRIYPEILSSVERETFIAINTAFDRSYLRFGEKIGEILSGIAKCAKRLSQFYKIKFYSHSPDDEKILPFFDSYDVAYELVRLNHLHPREILKEYAKPALVLGMRGHAQMIPFGCGTPIVSIISHNKLQWFLDDIEKPEWGADVLDDDFEEKLYQASINVLENFEDVSKHISKYQEKFWDISMANISYALEHIDKAKAK